MVGMPLASTRSPGIASPPWAKDTVPISRVIAAAERADFTYIILEHLRLEKIIPLSAQLVAGKRGNPRAAPLHRRIVAIRSRSRRRFCSSRDLCSNRDNGAD